MSTKIIALGTGAAFTLKNFHTNFIIQRNGKNLLIDAGSDLRWSLDKQGMSFKDIDGVYISHSHQDHCALEYLGFTRYFTRRAMIDAKNPNPLPLPKLFCERNLCRDIWEHSARGGMSCLEGIEANLDTYFDVKPVDKNGYFEWEGLKFELVQALHISSKYSFVDSFGIIFTDDNNKRIYFTTDVAFCPENLLKACYKEADIIIHDCETAYRSSVHSHFDDLSTLDPTTKAKMILTHFQDNVMDDWNLWQEKAKDAGFQGFAAPGLIYEG
jgi:ribonuclease BN (tRNA processing enzyme)